MECFINFITNTGQARRKNINYYKIDFRYKGWSL